MNKSLRDLMKSGRIPQALVIDGSDYEARLETAKEIAASLLCTETQKPCRECISCKKAFTDTHPDIKIILPDSKKKTLSVDIIRDMREDAYILPNESEHKVYIIAKAELMQDYAQNALLKILEEPPAYASFMLLCDTHSVLLSTVLSRAAVFTLSDNRGEEENENYLEACKQAEELAGLIAARDEFGIMCKLAFFEKNYDLLTDTLNCLQLIFRDVLVLLSGGNTMLSSAPSEVKKLAASYSRAELLKILDGISDIIKSINIYGNKNLVLARLASKLKADA